MRSVLGTCKYASGDEYRGHWDNDKKNGEGKYSGKIVGVLRQADGGEYEGEWKEDIKEGSGRAILQL